MIDGHGPTRAKRRPEAPGDGSHSCAASGPGLKRRRPTSLIRDIRDRASGGNQINEASHHQGTTPRDRTRRHQPDQPGCSCNPRPPVRSTPEVPYMSLPLILEPIWFPLPGEDPSSASWRSRRAQGIVSSAIEANQLGIDLLKVEFPGYVNSERDQSRAAAACQELDAGIDVPWVLLSAGVGYAAFATQMRIAGEAGASGFMAGRSIWRDAVATKELAARTAALAQARDRLEELAAITRRHGHPHLPVRPLPEVLQALPDGWYRNWAQTS